ncbi:Ig-like domain-containing protein [Halalkalibaculum sp. DA3122]|uniref:Ig-like domain-containing protein n=1 Tax=unclassified Halalkalibaculum TaxID=2964617 RepID=UPI0037551967
MRNLTVILLLFGFLVYLAGGCATPTSPSGGEPDQEGPRIIQIQPEPGTTNFGGREIEISFSEFVERSSLREAIVIEPDIGLDYSLDWGRKSVAIEFDQELPDSTTILVTIGTDLSDTRGNEMTEPQKIAVSTGPDIDEGEIAGRIVDAQTGKGDTGDRVLLYRRPVDLSRKADYLAQTDTSGRFNFSYLSPGEYKVFWVNDQNRSKIWEKERERAQPFYREMVTLEKAGKDTLGTIYKDVSDTTRPRLQGVGLFSSRRMRLRFSENIQLTDSSQITIADTLGEKYTDANPLYVLPNEQYVLFAESEDDLGAQQSYQVEAKNIRDLAGNNQPLSTFQFEGSAQEDTTQQRIIGRKIEGGVYPGEPLEIIYAKSITGRLLTDSLQVVAGDSLIEGWQHVEIAGNRLRIAPPGEWEQGLDYEIRAWNPGAGRRKSYALEVWHPSDFGNIEFALADSSDNRSYHLALTTSERGLIVDTTFSESVELKDLAPLEYKAIIYGDLNDNGEWDSGQVQPFKAPEPYFIQRNIPVEKAFTSEVTVTFE